MRSQNCGGLYEVLKKIHVYSHRGGIYHQSGFKTRESGLGVIGLCSGQVLKESGRL